MGESTQEPISGLFLLLERNRMGVPIPFDVADLAVASMPPEVIKVLKSEGQALDPSDEVRRRNLRVILKEDVRVSFDIYKNGEFSGAFYVQTGGPCLSGGVMQLIIPPDFSGLSKLLRWHERATKLENELMELKSHLTGYMMGANTLARINLTWPELMSYIKTRVGNPGGGMSAKEVRLVREELKGKPPYKIRERIITLLAAGSLIDKYHVAAWPTYAAVRG